MGSGLAIHIQANHGQCFFTFPAGTQGVSEGKRQERRIRSPKIDGERHRPRVRTGEREGKERAENIERELRGDVEEKTQRGRHRVVKK